MESSYRPGFTLPGLVSVIRAIAGAMPDYIYRGNGDDGTGQCFYLRTTGGNENGDACIIGRALTALGVPAEFLAKYETETAATILGALFGTDSLNPETELDKLALWCLFVQKQQDQRHAWGDAITYADNVMQQRYPDTSNGGNI